MTEQDKKALFNLRTVLSFNLEFLLDDLRDHPHKLAAVRAIRGICSLKDSLNDEDLEKIVRVLTIADPLMRTISAAQVYRLLEALAERKYADYEDLLDWVFKTNDGKNAWLATGQCRYGGCKSLAEYKQQLQFECDRRQQIKLEAQATRIKKAEVRRLKANKNIWAAIRRRDYPAITAMLAHGVDLLSLNGDGNTVRQKLIEIGLSP